MAWAAVSLSFCLSTSRQINKIIGKGICVIIYVEFAYSNQWIPETWNIYYAIINEYYAYFKKTRSDDKMFLFGILIKIKILKFRILSKTKVMRKYFDSIVKNKMFLIERIEIWFSGKFL